VTPLANNPAHNPAHSAQPSAVVAPTLHATLPRGLAVQVFLAFALAYFLSALVRGITATLSPVLQAEFALSSGDLGLLAGMARVQWCLAF
jgi:sugar phosphate permease